MIDLFVFFEALQKNAYSIVKYIPLDEYKEGNDIDIFCFDVKEIIRVLSVVAAENLLSQGYNIDIYECENENHVQFDIMNNNKLVFKFDIYGELPTYEKINIKDSFFAVVIENAEKSIYINNNSQEFYVKHASVLDELLLRYIEYIEWYEIRPDKVKHLDYIIKKSEENENNTQFLDKLYYYTKLPEVKAQKRKKKRIKEEIVNFVHKVRYLNIKKIVAFIQAKMDEKCIK